MTSRSGRGTTPRAASSRRALRLVTSTATTANAHTGYCTSQATRNARDAWTNDERWRALAAVSAEVGIEITRLGPFVPTLEQGLAAADVGLASGASALVAFNDLLAIGTLQRLERRGVDVPGEISVVGYDDIFGSDFCHPPLTTITGPVDEAGRTLVDVLLGSIAVGSGGQLTLPTQLRVRDSTGPASHSPRVSRQ